mmetsp:Transcript_39589/g.86451  ORF Transcript_39589/g.86451 Transcript_39589/m.86451 type:complete len:394 (+) Transcript_39589:106-1287(+)
MQGQVYIGTIKSFNPDKGWGHIECDETRAIYDKDIFLLRSQLNGNLVNKGQKVSFQVTDGTKGPEATSVEVISPVPMAGMAPGRGAWPGAAPVGSGLGACGAGGDSGYIGMIKSFRMESGWGHIACEQTQLLYGKDIFFMKSQVPGGNIAVGTQVHFTVTQGMKGPEAANIAIMGGPAGGLGNGYGGGAFGGPCGNGPCGNSPCGNGIANNMSWGAATQNHMGNQVYYGTVKSFSDEKGWGHISCPQTQAIYGKDIFLLRRAIFGSAGVDPMPGDQVQFSVVPGMKGPEAAHVRVLGKEGHQLHSGVIKQFSEEKGWGHIACDETRQIYGKDIFVHKKELGDLVPTGGEQVQFAVRISQDGRPEASNVSCWSYGDGYGAIPPMARPRPFAEPY